MKTRTTYLTTTALLAAMIFITTAFFLHIPIGLNGGYIHVGDALIFLAASLLPRPYAICAAVIGGTLADLATVPIWAPATAVIKMLLAISLTNKSSTIIHSRNIIGLILAFPITILGYFVAEGLLFGNFAAAIPSIAGNFIQCAGSCIIYIIIGKALDQMSFKNKFV